MSGELIFLGIVIAIEPLPIAGFILVLGSPRGVGKGAAFLALWMATVVAIVVATLLLTGGRPIRNSSTPGTAVTVGTLLLGVGLIGFAAYRIRRLRLATDTSPATQPGWMRRLDGLTPWGAAALAFLLQPWTLVAAGAATIAHADLGRWPDVLAIIAFCLVSSASLIAMELNYVIAPEAARRRLDAVRRWIEAHRNRAVTLISAVVGVWLVVQGASSLASA